MEEFSEPTDLEPHIDGGHYYKWGIHTVKGDRVIYNGNFYLGKTTTVFQAEVTAIRKSAQMLIDNGCEKQTITFYSDSQASLAALDKLTIKSDTVDKCLKAINALGEKNRIFCIDINFKILHHFPEVLS